MDKKQTERGVSRHCRVTKRSILSKLAQNCDPLTFLAPSNLKAKLLVQSLRKGSFTWDEGLSEEVQREWNEIQRS